MYVRYSLINYLRYHMYYQAHRLPVLSYIPAVVSRLHLLVVQVVVAVECTLAPFTRQRSLGLNHAEKVRVGLFPAGASEGNKYWLLTLDMV